MLSYLCGQDVWLPLGEVALAPYLASLVTLTLSPEAGPDIGSQGSAGVVKSGVELG